MSDSDLFESDEEVCEETEDHQSNKIQKNTADFEVIPGTPQNRTKTNHFKSKATALVENDTICSNKLVEDEENDLEITPNCEYLNSYIIRKPPYVFFEIRDVSQFNNQRCPLNTNLKLIGVYSQSQSSAHFLLEHRKPSKYKILLDFKNLNSLPKPRETIEIFGCILCNSSENACPTYVVHFWKYLLGGNIDRYIQELHYQKRFVPLVHQQIQLCDNNVTELSFNCNEEANNCFEDVDESILKRNVDQLEINLQEFDEIMRISVLKTV